MKLIIFLIMLSFPLFAQSIEVVSLEKVTDEAQGKYFYPKFIDESRIVFTSSNYKGLWIIDDSFGIRQMNDFDAAGFEFQYLPEENSLLLRKDKFIDGMRFTDVIKQNIHNREIQLLNENLRNVRLLYDRQNNSLSIVSEKNIVSLGKSAEFKTNVYADAEGIHLIQNGNEKLLKPVGEGNYIWASISPDKSKILFNYPSKGSFVCDLSGNILFELGYANYPSWSREGNWIIYMKDYDNGVEITSSDIFIRKYLGKDEINLTNTKDKIELYPSYSQFADEILFNTIEGVVYKLSIKFN